MGYDSDEISYKVILVINYSGMYAYRYNNAIYFFIADSNSLMNRL